MKARAQRKRKTSTRTRSKSPPRARPLSQSRAKLLRTGSRLLSVLQDKGLLTPRAKKQLYGALETAVKGKSESSPIDFSANLNSKLAKLVTSHSLGERDRLGRQMGTLDSISKVVFSCTRDDRVLEKCLTLLRDLVPFQNGAVFILKEDTGKLDLAATLGYPQDLIERVQFDLGQGLSAWAAREKRAVLVKELTRPEKDGMPPLGSFLAVPIVAGGRSVGVITMGHPEPGAFISDHKRVLQLFCTLISGSVFAMLLERRRAASSAVAA
jgi:transcriptional regulator with GAF, ATPase, and Fis domain